MMGVTSWLTCWVEVEGTGGRVWEERGEESAGAAGAAEVGVVVMEEEEEFALYMARMRGEPR